MPTQMTLDIVEPGSDEVRLEELSQQLRGELLELDVEQVAPATEEAPDGTRSGLGVVAGTLVASLSQPAALVGVVRTVVDWLRRDRGQRTVRVEIDGDVLELTGADDDLQRKVVDDWLARHAST